MPRHDSWSASSVLAHDFGKLTGFVHGLARRLLECEVRLSRSRKIVRKLEDALGRKRKHPVLIVVEPDGEFHVYGDRIDVAVAHIPVGDWRGASRTLVERYVDMVVGEQHAALHLPSKWQGKGGASLCPTVGELIDAALMEAQLESLEEKK